MRKDSVPASAARPVVYDEKTGSLGVVTGAVTVQWSEPSADRALATDYGLSLVQSFEGLKTSYYQSSRSDADDLLQLLEKLKHDRRVVDVSLQILEHTVRGQ
jgi:hypothetical protein